MKVQLGANNTPLPASLELDATRAGKGEGARSESVAGGPAAPAGGVDAQLLGAYQPYIQQAAAASEVNASAVAEARKAIEDGTLDTPEAVGRLAGRLLAEGI